MARFYGQVFGSASTPASRRGTQDISVSAQSWNGSVIIRLHYDGDDLMVDIQMAEGSTATGYTVFYGTFNELRQILEEADK